MSTATITQQQAKQLVQQLEALANRMETKKDADWIAVAKAAALLESLRLGLATITPAQTEWLRIDIAKPGSEQPVTRRKGEYRAN